MDLNNFFIQGGLIKYRASRHPCDESWIPAVQATARKTQQRCTTTVNMLILFWMESHSHQLFTHSGVKIWQQTLDWRHWEGLQKRMSLLGRTGLSWENKSCCLDNIFYYFSSRKWMNHIGEDLCQWWLWKGVNQNDCQELLCFCSFVFDSEGEVGVQQQVLYNFADSLLYAL